jgi:hypothetical protein
MKRLRIVYGSISEAPDCEDLAVTPVALAGLSAANRPYLQPVDHFLPDAIIEIKWWVTATIEMMEAEWRQRGVLPLFLQSVGFDLCVLLESIKVSDLVLTSLWNTGRFSEIQMGPYQASYPMLEYSGPYGAYADLLRSDEWRDAKSIRVVAVDGVFGAEVRFHHAPLWKESLKAVRSVWWAVRRQAVACAARAARALRLQRVIVPELIVVPHKDTGELLACKGAMTLDMYLTSLPPREKSVTELTAVLVQALEDWFAESSPAMRRLGLFKGIIRERVLGFIRTRQDLVAAYVAVRESAPEPPPTLLLASSGGCSPDAWVSMALREKGGVIGSGQHGGAYGNLACPYYVFSDFRFDVFFSYGSPELSPTYEFAREHGRARWIGAGSPILKQVRGRQGKPPQEVKKILYVMNLSVSFYSANFPWEQILSQFKTLELLNRFADAYSIHVKGDQTGAVRRALYPGLHFINRRPKEVFHEYDLLILESGMSTAVLEGAATNKFVVVFTGSEWEDVTSASLDLLAKRAECFHRWEDFLPGLERILEDPAQHLDPQKLRSDEFVEAYGRPVSAEQYVATVRHALSLS